MPPNPTILFQSAKLGDVHPILAEIEWAEKLLEANTPAGRIMSLSGGSLAAWGFGLALAARQQPQVWGKASRALADLRAFLSKATSWQIRRLNLNPWYGFYNLKPLRRWLEKRLTAYTGRADWRVSDLGLPIYFCTLNHDAILTMFGPPDPNMQFQYDFVHVGPPQDAPLLDAVIASLSTLLSTAPIQVNGEWVWDCRPAISSLAAFAADLDSTGPILRRQPYTPVRPWRLNWFTSSFVMHSQSEQNQNLLAEYYLDLFQRHQALQARLQERTADADAPVIGHVNLPYIGSTEAATNMRESAANRHALLARFQELIKGQLDAFPFDQPANVIYGAGGFSGILGGLTATRAVDLGFSRGGGEVRQIYGVSAGVLNGFFHAVKLAALRNPDLYTPAAKNALADLENFMATCEVDRIAQINKDPRKFWAGWGNLTPLEQFLKERLAAYTGSTRPESLTFDEIQLPMTVVAGRRDGFSDFLGMSGPDRQFQFAGRLWKVQPAPVVRSLIAGWSMNTYIMPTEINGQQYLDGGGTFYDPALFVAMFDPQLTNLLNIHLDEPEGNTYNLGPHINFLHIVFDTQNLTFPEERRRMRRLANLLYAHFHLRAQAHAAGVPVEDDFRRSWEIQ